jgi:hypothetical protein
MDWDLDPGSASWIKILDLDPASESGIRILDPPLRLCLETVCNH